MPSAICMLPEFSWQRQAAWMSREKVIPFFLADDAHQGHQGHDTHALVDLLERAVHRRWSRCPLTLAAILQALFILADIFFVSSTVDSLKGLLVVPQKILFITVSLKTSQRTSTAQYSNHRGGHTHSLRRAVRSCPLSPQSGFSKSHIHLFAKNANVFVGNSLLDSSSFLLCRAGRCVARGPREEYRTLEG